MSNEQTIKCVFCKGLGNNPHFRGTCPVCKGRGENKVTGKYMTCDSCHGSGQKRGTTLTCFDCDGLGVVPDTRETFRIAREEIREAQKDLAKERPARRSFSKDGEELTADAIVGKITQKTKDKENLPPSHFCQCCGDEVNDSIIIKICSGCFDKVKELRGYKGSEVLATFGLKEI